jgi:hypothetical protein
LHGTVAADKVTVGMGMGIGMRYDDAYDDHDDGPIKPQKNELLTLAVIAVLFVCASLFYLFF